MTGQTVMEEFSQDLGIWSGRTLSEPSVREPQKGQTSRQSSKRSSKSQKPALMCVCVCRTKDGQRPDAITLTMVDGVLPGVPTIVSSGAYLNGGEGLLSWPISTDLQRRPFYLTMNIGEKPRIPNPTKLSEILEPDAGPMFMLSAKACIGILNRAERRGKELPAILKEALENQAGTGYEPPVPPTDPNDPRLPKDGETFEEWLDMTE